MRNKCLNFFKGIACIMVVFIHFPFPGMIGNLIYNFAGFAVPLFFLISGYYSYNENRQIVAEKLRGGRIRHIGFLCISSMLIYLIYTLISCYIKGGIKEITLWASQLDSVIKIIKPFFYGNWTILFSSGPLWFLWALLWTYVIFYFINKFNLYSLAYGVLPVVFLFSFFCNSPFMAQRLYPIPTLNFALYGLPYFLLGNWLAKHIRQILKLLTVITFSIGILIGTVSVLLDTVNVFPNCIFNLGFRGVGAFIFAVMFLLYAQKNPQREIINVLGIIGERYSLFVYIMHMILGNTIYSLCEMNGWFMEFVWIKPILVVLVTITGAVLWDKFIKFFHRYQKMLKSFQST